MLFALKKLVQNLHKSLQQPGSAANSRCRLRFLCVEQEKAEAMKSLAKQKKVLEDLKLVVSEREKEIKEIEQLLAKLRSESDDITKKNKVMKCCLESLTKEKDIVQKGLCDAQRDIHDWKAKYESAGKSSKQALTMLKNTAAFLASEGLYATKGR